MPWILAGGGVVVVAVVVVLIIVLTSGADTSSPQGVAEAAVSAANDQDIDSLVDLTCEADKTDVEKVVDPGKIDPSLSGMTMNFELQGVQTQGDDKATATVMVTYGNVPDEIKDYVKNGPQELSMRKEGSDWCISFASAGASPS
jgi:hypothetical protein